MKKKNGFTFLQSKKANPVLKFSKTGFTLLEILIFITVSSLAGILLVSILVQNSGLFIQQTAKINQGVDVNSASQAISESIRSATGVVASYTDGSTTYTTDSDTLVLSLASVNSQGSVIGSTYDYLVVTADPSNPTILKKLLFPDAQSIRKQENIVLLKNLSQIIFYYLDGNKNPVSITSSTKISYVLKLSENIGLKAEQASASGEVNLRNN